LGVFAGEETMINEYLTKWWNINTYTDLFLVLLLFLSIIGITWWMIYMIKKQEKKE
jgi:hypothetical protein